MSFRKLTRARATHRLRFAGGGVATTGLRFLLAPLLAFALSTPGHAADRETLLVYNLLGLDQSAIHPDGAENPLADLAAWSELYDSTLTAAGKDNSPDKRDLKTFMLIGWIARARNDFATIEAFNTDFKKLFDQRPDEVLKALAANQFMIGDMCATLAGYFFIEDAKPDDREGFIQSNEVSMASFLGADRLKICLDAFWNVKP